MGKLQKLLLISAATVASAFGQAQWTDFSSSAPNTSNLYNAMNAKLNYQTYAGNPNGNLAGTAGKDRAFDSVGLVDYSCTVSGSTTTAVWTKVVMGTAAASQGGTGQTSYTTGDLVQATGSTTLSKLAAVATGNALISGGVATASTWGKIGLTTHISGIPPLANGGLNTSTAPTSAQFPVGNAGGTAYVPVTMSGDATMSNAGVVTLTAALKVWSKDITIFDPVAGDSGRVQFRLPFAGHITSVACAVKAATSATINFDIRAVATPDTGGTAVLGSGLACDVDSAVTTTISSAAVAADLPVALTISAVSGTPDTLRVTIKGTID